MLDGSHLLPMRCCILLELRKLVLIRHHSPLVIILTKTDVFDRFGVIGGRKGNTDGYHSFASRALALMHRSNYLDQSIVKFTTKR